MKAVGKNLIVKRKKYTGKISYIDRDYIEGEVVSIGKGVEEIEVGNYVKAFHPGVENCVEKNGESYFVISYLDVLYIDEVNNV